ncbi:MAG: hypothetical protein R6U32_06105 [Candidatus Woesearchaeota archaeon]
MSSKIKLIYVLIGILLLLVSVRGALALEGSLEEDFNAYASQKTIYVCPCSSEKSSMAVENTGDTTSTYSIEQSGPGERFSTLTEKAFSLKPGERKEITNFVRVPCGIKGEYKIDTIIKTVFDTEKEFSQTIKAKDCVNIGLRMVKASAPVCPCSPAEYTFSVQNTGPFLETYNLEMESEYAELSEDVLILEPQSKENVTVFITTPCGSYGDLDFTLKADTERSGMTAELPFNLQVAPCYNYTMGSPGQHSICQESGGSIPVTIKNTAEISNTYFLSSDTEWTAFDNSSIALAGGQEKTVNLNIFPYEVRTGTHNVTIDAVTARGEIRKTLSIAAEVEDCHSINMSAPEVWYQLVEGEEGPMPFNVKNDGSKASEYSFNHTGPEWLRLETNRLGLDEGTEKEINLYYDVPLNTTGTYAFELKGSIESYPEETAAIGFTAEIMEREDAYSLEINAEDDDIDTSYEGKTITLRFSNDGIREGDYLLSVHGNNWTHINRTRISVEPGEEDTAGMSLLPQNATPEGKYPVRVDAQLEGTNIAYSRNFDINLRESTLWEKTTRFFSSYWIYMLSALLLILILAGAVIGGIAYRNRRPKEEKPKEAKPKEEKLISKEKPGWLRRILLLLLLLILLAGIAITAYHFAIAPITAGNATNITNATGEGPEEPAQPEELPSKPFTNATIFVNRTGLEGEGNVIEVVSSENITIPLIIQNSDRPNTYRIRVSENITWVRTDKDLVSIPPGERETINLLVTPTDEVREGSYNLSVRINVAGKEKPITEEIVLSIEEREPFYERYMWYVLGGLLLLAILLAAIKTKEYREKKGSESASQKKKQESGKERRKEEHPEKDYSRIKNILMIAILILIALLLAAGAIYLGSAAIAGMISSGTANATEDTTGNESGNLSGEASDSEELDEEPQDTGTDEGVSAEDTEEEGIPEEEFEEVFVKQGTETLVPVRISNVNKTTKFRISVREDVDWIYMDNTSVEISPGENRTINLVAAPNSTVEEGNYKVTVGMDITGKEKPHNKHFILKVRESRFSGIFSYLYYIIGGLIALGVMLALLRRREKSPESGKAKEKKPKKQDKGKKKTGLKLK